MPGSLQHFVVELVIELLVVELVIAFFDQIENDSSPVVSKRGGRFCGWGGGESERSRGAGSTWELRCLGCFNTLCRFEEIHDH